MSGSGGRPARARWKPRVPDNLASAGVTHAHNERGRSAISCNAKYRLSLVTAGLAGPHRALRRAPDPAIHSTPPQAGEPHDAGSGPAHDESQIGGTGPIESRWGGDP